jgi:hypothetical protein
MSMICRRRREEMRGAEKKRTTEGGQIYTAVLLMEIPTDNRIIFVWAVALNSIDI